jgi:hypothetical protein
MGMVSSLFQSELRETTGAEQEEAGSEAVHPQICTNN